MTCREFIEFLIDYDAGGLPDGERTVFEDHLAACPECQMYLRTYRQAVRLGQAAFAPSSEPVPAEVPDDLIAAIVAARNSL